MQIKLPIAFGLWAAPVLLAGLVVAAILFVAWLCLKVAESVRAWFR